MSAKVSIIIPVYNGEKFIKRCLNSISQQTYPNIETICIDDGSTDKSRAILQTYPDVILLKQKNSGAGKARNRGIQKSSGQFITFVDIDDTIDPDYIATLVQAIGDNDVVVSGYRRRTTTKILGEKAPGNNDPWAIYKYSSTQFKLYRSDIIKKHHLTFSEQFKIGEDMYFTMSVIASTNKITSIHYVGYNNYVNDESLTATSNQSSSQRNEAMLDLLKAIYHDFGKSRNIDWESLNYFFIKAIVIHLLTQRKILDGKTYRKECDLYFNWLAQINRQHHRQLHQHWQKHEELSVNFICNLFLLAHKTKTMSVLLKLLQIGTPSFKKSSFGGID